MPHSAGSRLRLDLYPDGAERSLMLEVVPKYGNGGREVLGRNHRKSQGLGHNYTHPGIVLRKPPMVLRGRQATQSTEVLKPFLMILCFMADHSSLNVISIYPNFHGHVLQSSIPIHSICVCTGAIY